MSCKVEVGDKVKWQKLLLTSGRHRKRVKKKYEGIVEKIEASKSSDKIFCFVRMNVDGGQIVSAGKLEIVDKNALNGNGLEGNQTVMKY